MLCEAFLPLTNETLLRCSMFNCSVFDVQVFDVQYLTPHFFHYTPYIIMMKQLLVLLTLLWVRTLTAQDTFSIVAVDPNTGEIGSAGASCLDNIQFPGSNGAIVISDIIPGRGAIHTQALWNATNQNNARQRMLDGMSPEEIIAWLKTNGVGGVIGSVSRQYGIVDFDAQGMPRAAAFTGTSCMDWKGHRVGPDYAIQGNILVGPQILDSMEARFLQTAGLPLAERLMYSLQGANVVGADTRCAANGTSSLSAFIRMSIPSDTVSGTLYLDLNVPSLPAGQEPIDSLQTLFNAWSVVAVKSVEPEPLRLFPNPTRTGDFSLNWPGAEGAILHLNTAQGGRLNTWTLKKGLNHFQTTLPAGMYFLQAEDSERKTISKGRLVVFL